MANHGWLAVFRAQFQRRARRREFAHGLNEQVEAIVSDIELPSLDELTASIRDWTADRKAEAWSDGVSSLVEDIARHVAR